MTVHKGPEAGCRRLRRERCKVVCPGQEEVGAAVWTFAEGVVSSGSEGKFANP